MINEDDKNLNLKNTLERLEQRHKVLNTEWDYCLKILESLRLDKAAAGHNGLSFFALQRDIEKKEADRRALQDDLDSIESEIEITKQQLEDISIMCNLTQVLLP